jgi:hypothetical protein
VDSTCVFARTPAKHQSAFVIDLEFSGHFDCCIFETLIELFSIRERAVLSLAEGIYDAELEDDKFHRVKGFGLDQILKGWAKLDLSDEEILLRGFQCLDGLRAQFKLA